jgi:hypothetical protein
VLCIGTAASNVAGAAWTAPATLAYSQYEAPLTTIDSQGRALVVWGDGYSIKAATGSANGTFTDADSPIYVDSGRPLYTPQMDADPPGNAVIVWRRKVVPHQIIFARGFTTAGTRRPIQQSPPRSRRCRRRTPGL